ncbi:MAG: type II toxin-antitoxin system mRNA interferase toxin, RelE/StbE family [Candidatus Levybacteria bacterium]|nr:type II toxin-antitoxin system mRNA interferase toxin, RelE/StbE family [Candidatus Levybacteria bacterium]
MNVDFTKAFNKQFEKLPQKRQEKAKAAVALFLRDITAPSLRNHALKGEWLGFHSISAGGDIRLHFKVIDQDTVLFVAVGSHSQLYK